MAFRNRCQGLTKVGQINLTVCTVAENMPGRRMGNFHVKLEAKFANDLPNYGDTSGGESIVTYSGRQFNPGCCHGGED